MRRTLLMLITVVLAAFLAVTPVLAAEGHVYGVVFVDSNLNGVWDVGEKGLPDVAVEFESANGDTTIELTSAPANDEIDENADNACDYLDPDAPTPCPGTWGLNPAGQADYWWKVSVTPPAGYYVTSENPQWVKVQEIGSEEVVQFGVAPVGAGGPSAVMPVTGAGLGLYAAGLLLATGVGLTLKSRRRK